MATDTYELHGRLEELAAASADRDVLVTAPPEEPIGEVRRPVETDYAEANTLDESAAGRCDASGQKRTSGSRAYPRPVDDEVLAPNRTRHPVVTSPMSAEATDFLDRRDAGVRLPLSRLSAAPRVISPRERGRTTLRAHG
ncbi:hypothetical protein [Natrononativus amylolyticus]|uniref:hypothetical protein n=1 Tax=Natrononativus amylolyticus TaxID=2963434 RepID=UPI0020CCFDBD|nr:hypothetical protein [Natrononativus amylolyticus]